MTEWLRTNRFVQIGGFALLLVGAFCVGERVQYKKDISVGITLPFPSSLVPEKFSAGDVNVGVDAVNPITWAGYRCADGNSLNADFFYDKAILTFHSSTTPVFSQNQVTVLQKRGPAPLPYGSTDNDLRQYGYEFQSDPLTRDIFTFSSQGDKAFITETKIAQTASSTTGYFNCIENWIYDGNV